MDEYAEMVDLDLKVVNEANSTSNLKGIYIPFKFQGFRIIFCSNFKLRKLIYTLD